MKNSVESVLYFLGNSPLGSALKIGFAASLVWLVDNVNSINLPPAASIFIVAALPTIINWINPEDTRYGINSFEYLVNKRVKEYESSGE